MSSFDFFTLEIYNIISPLLEEQQDQPYNNGKHSVWVCHLWDT